MTIQAKHPFSLSALALPVLAVALGLSACGGGGQSASAPQAEEPAAFNWTHEAVRVRGAHEQVRDRYGADVLPGEGVSVAIIDSGIDLEHWAFDRERVTEVNLDREDATESGFVLSHGTSVASVIAAQPGAVPREFEDIGVRGVAPGARLTVFAVAERGPEGPTAEEELGWFGSALSPEAGVDILNISFGNKYDLISDYPDEAAVRGRSIASSERSAIQVASWVAVSGAGCAQARRKRRESGQRAGAMVRLVIRES